MAEKGSRFTLLFEWLAKADADRYGVLTRPYVDRSAWHLEMRRASRAHAPVTRIGIDEKSLLKRHLYVSFVVDLDEPRILHVANDRRVESLVSYFQGSRRRSTTESRPSRWTCGEPYRKTVLA